MALAIALTFWAALLAALHVYLFRAKLPAEPIIAGVLAASLGVIGLTQLARSQGLTEVQGHHDTYYILSEAYFMIGMALLYLIAATIAVLILILAPGRRRHLLVAAFWGWHLGAGATILTTALAHLATPERYVDFPGQLYWYSLVSWLGAMLGFLGAIALLILLGIALIERGWKGRTD